MNHDMNAPQALTIIGPGRVGSSIAKVAAAAGLETDLIGRDLSGHRLGSKVVLICVPDEAIPEVAAAIAAEDELPLMTGHTSGATTLEPLEGSHTDGAFSIHPLQTVPDPATDLAGCPCAVSGSVAGSADLARGLAAALGMAPFEVAEEDRALYHAAASIAANFLVTLEQTAADLLTGIGVDDSRRVLSPLVRRSLENWIASGGSALTGPIVRGDEQTVERQRAALADRRPDLLDLFDSMATATRRLAADQVVR